MVWAQMRKIMGTSPPSTLSNWSRLTPNTDRVLTGMIGLDAGSSSILIAYEIVDPSINITLITFL